MEKHIETVDTFDRLAKQYQSKYMDYELYQDTYDYLCDLLPDKNNLTILDIACGPGNITKYLLTKRPDLNVLGIDLAPKMIELARANNPMAQFKVMDGRDIASINDRFDAIICGFCTPYLSESDVAALFVDMRTLLNPGGIAYISTIEGDSRRSGFLTSSNGDRVYTYYYQVDFLQRCLERAGFSINNIKYKQFTHESREPVTDLFIYAQAV